MSERHELYDVIVVGSGIAGLTASLYLGRHGISTLVVTRDIGGQLRLATLIENYPGLRSIRGYDIVMTLEEAVRDLESVEIVFDEVVRVERDGNAFKVVTRSGRTYRSYAVILSVGKAPRELGVPGERELLGRGVSYCVVCDAPLYRNKTVAYVAWGEHSRHGIEVLSGVASKVYWISRAERPVRDESFLSRVLSTGKVELYSGYEVVEIRGSSRVESIVVRRIGSDETRELKVDGVFVEVGFTLKTDFLRGIVELNERGEIVIDKLCRTSCRGIFAAGDATDIPYKQAIIAAGQGAVAALSAIRYLSEMKSKHAKMQHGND